MATASALAWPTPTHGSIHAATDWRVRGRRGLLVAMTRCLLKDTGLPPILWGELTMTSAYLLNRAPHSARSMDTPHYKLYGKDADISTLRVICARAFLHIERRTKHMPGKAFEVRLCGTAPVATPGASTTRRQNHRGEHEHLLHTVETLARLLQRKPNDCYDTSDNCLRNLRDYTTRVNRSDLDFSDYCLGGSPAPPTHA